MSIWTEEELLEQIAAAKQSLKAADIQQADHGGSGHSMASIDDLIRKIKYYERELAIIRGQAGPISVVGRISR